MSLRKKNARIAGLLYLLVVVCGIYNLAYVPSKLINWEDPAATWQQIAAGETLFRLGMLGAVICYTAFLLLPLALYRLLKEVNHTHAVLMVALAVVSVPMSLMNLENKFAVLNLLDAADPGKADQVMFYLQNYSQGNRLASIFWGLWLLPLGLLVFRSGFLPKALGALLVFGCLGYLVDFAGVFFVEGYRQSWLASWITKPGSLGEIGICLWLLVIGAADTPAEQKPIRSANT